MHLNARSRSASFLSGVSMLTLSAVLVKVIGLLYRIPMLNLLGTEGMGYFNTAYEIFALFCMVTTAGMPVAMSVLISTLEAEGKHDGAERVYRLSLGLLAAMGGIGSVILWALAEPFAELLGNPLAAVCMRTVAPAVLLICLSAAFRGYFQGRRNMLPTAVSQVIEAGGKLALGLVFAGYARGMGADLPITAAYAMLGLMAGMGLSMVYLWVYKRAEHRRAGALAVSFSAEGERRPILRPLLATAIPVTLSAGVISLTKCMDLGLILRRLQAVGFTASEANALYGCYSTLAIPVFNIIPSLTTSVALSAVPTLSAALQKGKEGEGELRKTAAWALRLTMLVAIPSLFGVAVFAEDILSLLFAGQPEAVDQAAPWLSCLGLSIPAACLITVTGAMLQACGKANRSVFSMLVGVTCKVALA